MANVEVDLPQLEVRDGVDRFLDYYASVHRGTGFKS